MDMDAAIPRRLLAARRRLSWSREVLAYHSGVSWSAISQIEAGRRTNPRPRTLAALARALGVTVDYLVGEGPTMLLAHRALVYGSDDEFLQAIVPFVLEGVEGSEALLVVSSAANLESLEARLGSRASGITFADSRDWYTTPLATVTAYRSFAHDMLDEGIPWIRIVGEPLWSNRTQGEVALWATFESMFNLIFGAIPLTLLCTYDSRSADDSILGVARATHPHLVRAAQPEPNDAFVDPERFVLEGQRTLR